MKSALKWVAIVGGGVVVILVAALLVIPLFVDLQTYKPMIEERVSAATGRPFALGGDLKLSLFPWAGLSLSDLRLGNPPGFAEKDLLTVESFDVRVKLLPLVFRDVQIQRFVLKGPRVVLERLKDGRGNWEGIGAADKGALSVKPTETQGAAPNPLPIKSLMVGEFAVSEGSVVWIDRTQPERRELTDFNLRLSDVSLDTPIGVVLSALLDAKPVSLEGRVGPVGPIPGKGAVPIDLAVTALKTLDLTVKGRVVDPVDALHFDVAVVLAPFSARKLFALLELPFPVQTADPGALQKVGLKLDLQGDNRRVSGRNGRLELDDAVLAFEFDAAEFDKPKLDFSLELDKIDLDRYLPPAEAQTQSAAGQPGGATEAAKAPPDFDPLRRLVLDASATIGNLKAAKLRSQDLNLRVTGRNGVFRLNPLTLKLYQGDLAATGTLNLQTKTPRTDLALQMKDVQVGPLLRDMKDTEVLTGTTRAELQLRMAGMGAKAITSSLNGKGSLVFSDGVVTGLDLAGMLHNAKTAFGLAAAGTTRPQTDFSELKVPFTLDKGVFKTAETTLQSPALRVLAAGQADLVRETLDFRIDPKFVATFKGQGDAAERAGVTVPVLVSGTFAKPSFQPDLKGLVQQQFGEELKDVQQKIEKGEFKKDDLKSLEKKAKGILKGLPFGN
ncbi:MAG: AsmA family protein [Desulfobacterales bacterium]